MIDLATVNLSGAEASFLIANTPIFLLRRLQEDTAVRRISQESDGDFLLRSLKAAATKQPADLRDAVLPYALLVAVSMKMNDPSLLRRSTLIVSNAEHRWFDYLRTVLIQIRPSISHQTFDLSQIQKPSIRFDLNLLEDDD